MIKPMQTRTFAGLVGSQQASALPLQTGTLPAQTLSGLDMSSLMSMMITMMIVVMMMKMMTGAMSSISS